MKETSKVLSEVMEERKRQHEKWGEQNCHPVEWIAILTEEIGEASREIVDWNFGNDLSISRQISPDYLQLKRLENYRKECIQIAAVAVQMVESFDRNKEHLIDQSLKKNHEM